MRYGLSGDNAVVDTLAAGWKPPGGGFDFVPVFRVGVLPDGGVAFTDSSDLRDQRSRHRTAGRLAS